MTKSSDAAAASPSCRGRSKKPILRSSKAKKSPSPVQFSSKTPEKPPQRVRNRSVALSVADIRKAAGKRLQEQKQCTETTSSASASAPALSKSARRQISLWPSSSSSPSKPKTTEEDESFKLPEKYEKLDEFFNRFDTLISIHRLRQMTPTFTSISSRIESLTDRRFTHGHLAQMKFILPEAIVLKKHLVLDEQTRCMKPDIHISLDPASVEADPQQRRVLLKKVFRARLKEFSESHPEGVEIPEGELPEPFNRQKKESILESCLPTRLSLICYGDIEGSSGAPPATPSKTIDYTENKEGSFKSIDAMSTPARKTIEYTENRNGSLESIDATSTPAKLVSTPIRLMSATPALRSPKRRYMSPDDNSTSSLSKLARCPPRSRSLKFDTPVKNKESLDGDNAGGLPIDDDNSDILPENLIQSIREKERMAMEEIDPAITQAKKRKKNIASLPKLFDMIRSLLRQQNCITKVELISKIISSCSDIVDRSEAEERLSLLQELAPEWISEKQISSGDFLLFINKMSSPQAIRASLEEATT